MSLSKRFTILLLSSILILCITGFVFFGWEKKDIPVIGNIFDHDTLIIRDTVYHLDSVIIKEDTVIYQHVEDTSLAWKEVEKEWEEVDSLLVEFELLMQQIELIDSVLDSDY